MQKYKEPSPEDYLVIAEKVRSGEYFRESARMYDDMANYPMAERYFYLFVTAIAIATFLVSLVAMQSLYPLTRAVPFIYASNDVVEDMPRMIALRKHNQQSPNQAILFFLAENFVRQREEYNINTLEANLSGIRANSAPEIFAAYQKLMSPTNPESPVLLYQRHSSRLIQIVQTRPVVNHPNQVEVIYDAALNSGGAVVTTRHAALLEYQYSGIDIDHETGKVSPFTFQVTRYESKNIQSTP